MDKVLLEGLRWFLCHEMKKELDHQADQAAMIRWPYETPLEDRIFDDVKPLSDLYNRLKKLEVVNE